MNLNFYKNRWRFKDFSLTSFVLPQSVRYILLLYIQIIKLIVISSTIHTSTKYSHNIYEKINNFCLRNYQLDPPPLMSSKISKPKTPPPPYSAYVILERPQALRVEWQNSTPRLTSTPERRNGNINLSKYFMGIETTTSRFCSHTSCRCATTSLSLSLNSNIIF